MTLKGPFQLPKEVVARAEAAGEAGRHWVNSLPGLVAEIAELWSFSPSQIMAGGSAALVLDGTVGARAAVLKLPMPQPQDDWPREAEVLLAAEGQGYARLLAHDFEKRAMLLERLGQPLGSLGLSPELQMEAMATALKEAWIEDTDGSLGGTRLSGEQKAADLAAYARQQWETLGRPCAQAVLEQAERFAARRQAAFDPSRARVIHGDPHEMNALCTDDKAARALPPRVKFVDPEGLFLDPAYDLGVVLRDWSEELMALTDGSAARAKAWDWAGLLGAATGVDTDAIWEWGFLERVTTGLHLMELRLEKQGLLFLSAAERLVDDIDGVRS